MARKPRILPVDPLNPDPVAVRDIVDVLQGEGLVALPTDTLYGLAADIFSEAALERVVTLKARPHDKPIPVFISKIEDVHDVARDLPGAAWQLVERFWPGSLTLVLLAGARVPEGVTAGTGTVGVRIPQLPLVNLVLEAFAHPLTGTSANRSGGIDPLTANDVLRALGNSLELVVEGGRAPGGVASTVLDCTEFPFRIIREGAIPRDEIAAALGQGDLEMS